MKYLIKKSLVFVVLFTTLLVNANEISLRNLNDNKTTMLTLVNVKEGNKLVIKDNHGIILYKEFIEKKGGYAKGFDLTSLPDGNYFFELDKELEIKIIPFRVISNVVDFDKDKEQTIYKPYLRSEENLIYVSKLSLNKNPLTVKIYYQSETFSGGYELIHRETIENTENIQRAFRLDETKQGNYKVVFQSEGRSFVEYFKTTYSSKQYTKQKKNKERALVNPSDLKIGNEERVIDFKNQYYSNN